MIIPFPFSKIDSAVGITLRIPLIDVSLISLSIVGSPKLLTKAESMYSLFSVVSRSIYSSSANSSQVCERVNKAAFQIDKFSCDEFCEKF